MANKIKMANNSTDPHILPLPSGANRLSYAIPMPYIPSPPRYSIIMNLVQIYAT